MKELAWFLLLGGGGYFAWKKFAPAGSAGSASSPDPSADTPSPLTPASTSYIFNGQVGSNFYDASTLNTESTLTVPADDKKQTQRIGLGNSRP